MKDIQVMVQDMADAGMLVKPMDTGYVAAYELGLAMQASFYAQVRGDDLREGYIAHMATELGDCFMQLRVWAHLHHLDFFTLCRMGEEKLYERIEEMNSKVRPRPTDEMNAAPGGGVQVPRPRAINSYVYPKGGD